jgi:DNA-binding MarR family transcriptional regulator
MGVALEKSTDLPVREHLRILGISTLGECDVLTFLHHHDERSRIALLLGENKAGVSAALDRLASLGLLQRSRGSRGAGSITKLHFRQICRDIPALLN